MGKGRKWWMVLGVLTCAFVVLSLPTRKIASGPPTQGELLFRIQQGGDWELWHGPARGSQVRIVTGDVALNVEADPWEGAAPAEQALRASIETLRGMLTPLIRDGLNRVRVELPADQPFRFALRVAQAAALEGFGQFEVTNQHWGRGVPIGVAPDLAVIRRTDRHPEDPRLSRLVLSIDGERLRVVFEGIGAYPVGPAQGDFLPEGSRIKWGAPRPTEAGRWLCIGYDILEWESALDEAGVPTATDEDLRRAMRTDLAHLYVELPEFDVRSSTALHLLSLFSQESRVMPEYLVAGFDFENALGGG